MNAVKRRPRCEAWATLAAARSRPPSPRPADRARGRRRVAARAPDPWSTAIIVLRRLQSHRERRGWWWLGSCSHHAIQRAAPRDSIATSARRRWRHASPSAAPWCGHCKKLERQRGSGEPSARRGARGRRQLGASGGGRRDRREGARRPLRRARLPGDQVARAARCATTRRARDGALRQLRHAATAAAVGRKWRRARARARSS